MVHSNEHGRALEYIVRNEIARFASSKGLDVKITERTKEKNEKEKSYFGDLDKRLQANFASCAEAFIGWIGIKGWFDGAKKLVIDRVPDSEAKANVEMTDIRLQIYDAKGNKETKNLSVKHRHDALCHPRLPSLPEQCGITAPKICAAYRHSYKRIWGSFYSKVKVLGGNIKTYAELDKKGKRYRYDWLYEPLQKNATEFLKKHANNPANASAFFSYLVGKVEYFVLKNEGNYIEIKHFANMVPPKSFKITYPWNRKKTTFIMEFDNSWKITLRLHTASSKIEKNSKIFMTEKEDPICQNLNEVIKIEFVSKSS